MPEEQIPNSKPSKLRYVTPRILTLKVDLSFASSATKFEDLIQMPPERAKTERPGKANTAVVGGKLLSPNP
jgi:hypothetical protein